MDSPIAYSIEDACVAAGNIGRSTLYRAMDAGALRFVKIGGRRLILREDLLAWLKAGQSEPVAA